MAPRKPRAKSKKRQLLDDGVRRMATWCQANFPPRMQVRVDVVDDMDETGLGLAFIDPEEPGVVSILISSKQSLHEAMETTMHEWAHALIMPWLQEWQNDHEDGFWIIFGRMYRRWHDQGGSEAAKRL